MLWSKKPSPIHEWSRVVGIDLNASRARAVAVGGGKVRPLPLDGSAEPLPLFIDCDRRTPEVGQAGYALVRKAPHTVCSNFLPALAQDRPFRAGRHTLTAEAALELAFTKLREPVAAESEAAALLLPTYLTQAQVAKAVQAAARVRLPLKGTASAPLAIAAHRAAAVLSGKPATPAPDDDGVIPIRPPATGPGSVVIVDADEYALSAAIVSVERDAVRFLTAGCWPRASIKAWKDRYLDAISDRCVRLCRRDPRDSAEAEQSLFEQLDRAFDQSRAGHRVSLTVRTAHWFQDVILQPDDFDGLGSALAQTSAEGMWELVASAGLAVPPRLVWLTHEAGKLPGLARTIHHNTPEGTSVEVLPACAAAHAAAAHVPRWLAGELQRIHLDMVIPLPAVASEAKPAAEPAPRTSSTRG
jgi:hypothetical protein